MKLTKRQEEIIEIVKKNQPITSEQIAEKLNLTRAALRPDLAILTMTGILEARPKVGYVYSKKGQNTLKYKSIKEITVGEIKSKPTVVSEDMSIYDSIIQLFINDTGTLFVENKGYLTGAVSRKDFLKITLGNTDIHKVPVGIIMTRMPNIITITDNESAYEAARRIIEHEIDSLPVVEKVKTEDGKEMYKITGKVSKTTITRLFVELGKE
ncbi:MULTISPECIES: helix-turn-helix transcriptional regulator [Caloramator]|uniref:helix-turn-helix transcriptional regulator n=1 Tax=Caloramator TaxID=44258 RepID=UPI00192C9888|nr:MULTISPECIES: helix-turn-helix transcriptional regulator [Caloramator]MDO6354463.1 helix-turn-helix transcriptional regulator [Caloramator sp. CAR-1]